MLTETTRRGLRRVLDQARADGKRIAFVPTMGYLHEGHLSLIDCARKHGDFVVLSIFVNPLQFGPREDLAAYPRDFERDAGLAAERGVNVIFAPSADEMYPTGQPAVTVVATELAKRLEGNFRPGHFEGVLTVVAKLFNIVQPHAAIFGAKDFQQSVLVRRLCKDLDFDIDVVVAPTVREADGLALSSRNVYLNTEERQRATVLSRALRAAQHAFEGGETDSATLIAHAQQVLSEEPAVRVQYVELVDAMSLDRPTRADADAVISLAAFVGSTRLIDNMRMGGR